LGEGESGKKGGIAKSEKMMDLEGKGKVLRACR
jgi:hypothetical protein